MNPSFDALRTLFPAAPDAWLAAIVKMDPRWEINTPDRWAAFLGQVGHECDGFTAFEERLRYSKPERLMQVWPKRFPDLETAKQYVGSPEKLANRVYALRGGNGDEASGDGWRYHGRGPIQLTFKDNYRAACSAVGVDIVAQPQRVLEPTIGLAVAGWFWQSRGCNALADAENWDAITAKINGPAKLGLDQRIDLTNKARQAILLSRTGV